MKRTCVIPMVLLAAAGVMRQPVLAGPTDGPGPHPFVTGLPFSNPLYLTLAVAGIPDARGSIAMPIGTGTIEGEVTKASNDGGITYTGLASLELTGGRVHFEDFSAWMEFCFDFGSAFITGVGISGTLTSLTMPVNDPDFDGVGTFDPMGSVFLIDEGVLEIYDALGPISFVLPGPIVYDFATSPLALVVATSTGNLVDVPGTESVSVPDFSAAGDFDVGGPFLLNAKLSSEECGCVVPEPTSLAMAAWGAIAFVVAAVVRRRR